MIQVSPAREADLIAMEGVTPFSAKAVKVEHEGKVIAVGGVYYDGSSVVAFSSSARDASKRALVMAAHAIMDVVKQAQCPVLAIQNEGAPTAPSLLQHFGFEPIRPGIWRRG